jgi:malate dehydrogenase (oxaloacetate-decarboxylating)(NADP+)
MQANVALDFELMRQLYPFCRLTGAANVLLMPALHSAAISAKLLQQLGGGTVYGPILCGLAHAAQIVQTGATVSEIVTAAALASLGANAELLSR